MSSSNIIKGGEVAFRIHAFDPEAVETSGPDPVAAPGSGSVRLPCGPGGEDTSLQNSTGESESIEERLSRLEREAYEKGFEQGRKDGLELEEKQLSQQRNQVNAVLSELQEFKRAIMREAERDLAALSTLIAKRIVGEEIRTDPEVIRHTVRRALEFVSDRSRLRISLNPEDMEEMQRIMPELASMTEGGRIQVVEDQAVERGGCMLETGFGRINATVSEQLKVVEREIERAFASPEPEGS